jgi:hypothetical protein
MMHRRGVLYGLLLWYIIAVAWDTPSVLAVPGPEDAPVLWRQLVPASSTTREIFLTRSPQFVLFRDGRIVYRDDAFKRPYQQVRLSEAELGAFWLYLQNEFGLPGLTPNRLKRETPYIAGVQKEVRNDNTKVSIWIGIHNPPSLHSYTTALLEARSNNTRLGPAWDALYRLHRYLAAFTFPKAEPYVPDRVEIAVQDLPSYRSGSSASAAAWPFPQVNLATIKGDRRPGFQTLTGEAARQAYALLAKTDVVKSGDGVYLVWVRPLILP